MFHKSPQLQYPVGHEVAGVITEIGAAVTSLAKGDKVVGEYKGLGIHERQASCVKRHYENDALNALYGFQLRRPHMGVVSCRDARQN